MMHPLLDDDARGLVDEDERVVLEEDVDRHGTMSLTEDSMKMRWAMTCLAAMLLAGCVVAPGPYDVAEPYYYSPTYCEGCWYGQWGGRTGYHRGGGRAWERRPSPWNRSPPSCEATRRGKPSRWITVSICRGSSLGSSSRRTSSSGMAKTSRRTPSVTARARRRAGPAGGRAGRGADGLTLR